MCNNKTREKKSFHRTAAHQRSCFWQTVLFACLCRDYTVKQRNTYTQITDLSTTASCCLVPTNTIHSVKLVHNTEKLVALVWRRDEKPWRLSGVAVIWSWCEQTSPPLRAATQGQKNKEMSWSFIWLDPKKSRFIQKHNLLNWIQNFQFKTCGYLWHIRSCRPRRHQK